MPEANLIWVGLGAVAGLATAGVTVVSFWITFAEKVAVAKSKADAAHIMAEQAHKDAEDVHNQLAVHIGQVSLFREHIAREYPDHDALEAMEKRIMSAFRELGQRIDKLISPPRGGL